MSFRVMFLTGHLTGLLLGAALVWASASSRPLIRFGRAVPPSGSNWLPSGYSSGPQLPPLRDFDRNLHAVPHDWKPREFNGQPYYLIPIEALDRWDAI